jgi:hypothetical protein
VTRIPFCHREAGATSFVEARRLGLRQCSYCWQWQRPEELLMLPDVDGSTRVLRLCAGCRENDRDRE